MFRIAIEELIKWKEKPSRKPLIVRGARQVGKTYLLREFGAANFPAVHYFNFESSRELRGIFEPNLDTRRILDELALQSRRSINTVSDLLIFDEIQMCPSALTSLKYFCEEQPQIHICAAGSLLGVMLSPFAFPVGKVEFLNLYPMTFKEFVLALYGSDLVTYLDGHHPLNDISDFVHNRLMETFRLYLAIGGLPEVVETFIEHSSSSNAEGVFEARHAQQQLVDAYLADFAKHSGKVNASQIERLWRNIPEQLAKAHDGRATKFVFKDVVPGIRGYERLVGAIDWLEHAGLVLKVSIVEKPALPLSTQAKENSFKLYVFDTGLLGAISGLDPASILLANYGSYKGYYAENFVAQELAAFSSQRLYSWKEGESEVGFLLQARNTVIPLEVKAGRLSRARSLSMFGKKYAPPVRAALTAEKPKSRGNLITRPLCLTEHLWRELSREEEV